MIREIQLLAPPSPSLTHRLSSETRLDEYTTTLKRMAWEEDKKGKETKWRKTDHCRVHLLHLQVPFLDHYTKPATKALTSGCTTQLDHTDLEEPIATTKHKGHELWGHHSPAAFVRKRLIPQSPPQLQGQGPLMNAWELWDSFPFNSRVCRLYFHIQHQHHIQHQWTKKFFFPKVWVILNCLFGLSPWLRFYGWTAGKTT